MQNVAVAPSAPVTLAPRVDLYAAVHKGLRAMMADTLAWLGRVDPRDSEDLAPCLAQLDELLLVCRAHLEDENVLVHPALERARPGTTTRIAGEHEHHEEAISALCAELEAVRGAVDPTAGIGRLYRRLALFVAENLEHMQFEETVHNEVFWASYTDAELLAIQERIIASIPPATMAIFQRWMIPAVSHAERVGMLTGMRASAPPPVFAATLGLARAHLSARDYAKLAQALGLASA
jgi:hypothetical protein